ncbi:hypothetical protein OPQ81_001934 [Rhizoctonia solani]|nr:hypothetical protein OPQ81_001934 [Rhizoctonia solani]
MLKVMYLQATNPPKTKSITIALIIVFVVLVCILIFHYSMNIIRKRRKSKNTAALPQYAKLTPLQGTQNRQPYNPFLPGPTIIVTPPGMPIEHQPQDEQNPPPYELPRKPPPARSPP